jgi:hypothetical protein
MEGFFDCMKVQQAGVGSVAALMGWALYEPQRHVLLKRFRRIILLDGDTTGRKASAVMRTGEFSGSELLDLKSKLPQWFAPAAILTPVVEVVSLVCGDSHRHNDRGKG